MKNAFIATVGIGTGPESDITKPLIKSIHDANPDYLLLFATPESAANAQKITDDLGRNSQNSFVATIERKEDVEAIFKKMCEEITKLIRFGYEPSNIIADFTTGTKPMSAGLVLAAIKFKLGRLKYIMVERDSNRKVIEGTERMLTFEPVGIFSSYTIQSAIDFIKKYRFESAIEMIDNINSALLNPEERDLAEKLKYIAEAYSYWDKFEHIKFRATYTKAKFDNPLLQPFKVDTETLNLVHQIGETKKQKKLNEYMIIDLINNARRRMEEGKYDDATARFYRTIEMLGQWRLITKFEINHNDVDLEKVKSISSKGVDWLNGCRDKTDNKIKIALQKCFLLLSDLNDEMGTEFNNNDKLRGLLNQRNNSILAHGIAPVSLDTCKSLGDLTIDYCRKFITDFDKYLEILKFPFQQKDADVELV